jgi:hypothetical protein
MENKKGQVTIFIVLAIIIVAGVIVAFFLFGGIDGDSSNSENPKTFIENCMKEKVEESIDSVMRGGGVVDPFLYQMRNDKLYNYLCYQDSYYTTCVNQFPMLISVAEKEIKEDTLQELGDCFEELRLDLESQGFDVSLGVSSYNISLATGIVGVIIERDLSIVKGGDSQRFSDFSLEILSPIYDLIVIAREIVNQESQFCHFEYSGFMAIYPKYDLKKTDYDNSKLYRLIDRRSGKQFKFAVRSCVLPPGI